MSEKADSVKIVSTLKMLKTIEIKGIEKHSFGIGLHQINPHSQTSK